jgi:hypothetical protein
MARKGEEVDTMKKKVVLVMLIVAMLVPSMLFAKALSISLGGIAMYNVNAGEVAADYSGLAKIENYNFGADVRLKVLMFDITAMGLYNGKSTTADGDPEISGIVTAGLAFDLADFIRVGVGIGPRLSAKRNEGKWKVYQGTPGEDVNIDQSNFKDVFMNAPMTYRAMVDFMLGGISVGASYMVDTTYTFKNAGAVDDLVNCDWESGKLGVSLLLNIQ